MAYIPPEFDMSPEEEAKEIDRLLEKLRKNIYATDKSEEEKEKLYSLTVSDYCWAGILGGLCLAKFKGEKIYLTKDEHNKLIELINHQSSRALKGYYDDIITKVRKCGEEIGEVE